MRKYNFSCLSRALIRVLCLISSQRFSVYAFSVYINHNYPWLKYFTPLLQHGWSLVYELPTFNLLWPIRWGLNQVLTFFWQYLVKATFDIVFINANEFGIFQFLLLRQGIQSTIVSCFDSLFSLQCCKLSELDKCLLVCIIPNPTVTSVISFAGLRVFVIIYLIVVHLWLALIEWLMKSLNHHIRRLVIVVSFPFQWFASSFPPWLITPTDSSSSLLPPIVLENPL